MSIRDLPPRTAEYLQLRAQHGLTRKEVCKKMCIALSTACTHQNDILVTLGVNEFAQAVTVFWKEKIIFDTEREAALKKLSEHSIR